MTGRCLAFALYVSISLVSFKLSGYSCSSIVLLYSRVSVGARKDAKSLMIAGLMLYMSLALFGFMLFNVFRTFSSVVCLLLSYTYLFFWQLLIFCYYF